MKRNRTWHIGVGLGTAFLLACSLIGCNRDYGNNQAATTSGPKKLKLAFVTNNAADFWTYARAGCKKAEQEIPNVSVDFQITADGTAASQKRIIDDLLSAGVDGIAISPIDPANQTPMLNDVAKQAMVITQDSDAPNSDRACYLGTDNTEAGRQAGTQIRKSLPNGGKIILFVGSLDAQNARDRYNGIKEVLNGSNITILDVRTDGAEPVRAKANVDDALVKTPDVAGLVGLYSYNGPAILNAVRDAKKAKQIKIICFDEDSQTLAGIRDGDIDATIVQQPFEFGHRGVEILAKTLRGDKSLIPPGKQIFIPTLVIDKSGVDAFEANLSKLKTS